MSWGFPPRRNSGGWVCDCNENQKYTRGDHSEAGHVDRVVEVETNSGSVQQDEEGEKKISDGDQLNRAVSASPTDIAPPRPTSTSSRSPLKAAS